MLGVRNYGVLVRVSYLAEGVHIAREAATV